MQGCSEPRTAAAGAEGGALLLRRKDGGETRPCASSAPTLGAPRCVHGPVAHFSCVHVSQKRVQTRREAMTQTLFGC